jgi:hypothetical protein
VSNPLQHIEHAKETIKQRRELRAGLRLEDRSVSATETIADELTLFRAEMTVIREFLVALGWQPLR